MRSPNKIVTHVAAAMLVSAERSEWQRNGREFGQSADIYAMPEHAADIICQRVGHGAVSE